MGKLYVFESDVPENWPDDLKRAAERLGAGWPSDGPVVVPFARLETFRRRIMEFRGRKPDAILLVPQEASVPPDAGWEVDDIVLEGDWDRLRAVLQCARKWVTDELVEEIPTERLFDPTESVLQHLPSDVREHVAVCATCRGAFENGLRERRRLARSLCPGVDRLASYVRGGGDPFVEFHLERCRACRSEAEILQKRFPGALSIEERGQLREKVARVCGVGGKDVLSVGLGGLISESALAAAGPEARKPSLEGRVRGLAWRIWRQHDTCFLYLEAEGKVGRSVRLALHDPAWEEPAVQRVQLTQVDPGRLGATVLLGRIGHVRLSPRTFLFVVL